MTDTNHIEVLRRQMDNTENSEVRAALDAAITALSARASAGEGGELPPLPQSFHNATNQPDRQLWPGEKMIEYARAAIAMHTTAPQPAQAGASGGGGEVECPECKAALLYECVACSATNYPPEARNSKNLTTIMLEHADGLAAAAAALKAAVATRRECHVCQYDLLHDGPCDYTTPASGGPRDA